jgi:hypothetical protein
MSEQSIADHIASLLHHPEYGLAVSRGFTSDLERGNLAACANRLDAVAQGSLDPTRRDHAGKLRKLLSNGF